MRLGSLFAGIGGFDLAARWMGWETAWVSEIEPYASKVLSTHFPNAPNLGDITKIQNPPPVDILCGGFPCQDISLAGKGDGIGGTRSGLWTHYARLIGELRPRYVVAENVAALRSRGLATVLTDLSSLGYDAEWHCIPAGSVGALHRRDRIWIVAYPNGAGLGEHGRPLAVSPELAAAECGGVRLRRWDTDAWWEAEPDVGRVADGIPARVDRLRCLGNALVPQVAYRIFRTLAEYDRSLNK